jgi:hypothetical protein
MTSLFGVALDESRPQSINSSRKRRREEELKQENATLKAQFEKKEAKVQKLKFDFNILKYAKEKADERLSELEKVHEGFLQNQKKVEEETNTLKSENNALKLEKKALETEKQKEVDKLTQSLKQETGAKLLLQKKYIKLETEVKDLKTKLQEVTEKSASISQEELANLKKEHEKELVNLRKENENLQNTLFQMELKEKNLQEEKKLFQEKSSAKSQHIIQLSERSRWKTQRIQKSNNLLKRLHKALSRYAEISQPPTSDTINNILIFLINEVQIMDRAVQLHEEEEEISPDWVPEGQPPQLQQQNGKKPVILDPRLRPDNSKVMDPQNQNNKSLVSSVQPTETKGILRKPTDSVPHRDSSKPPSPPISKNNMHMSPQDLAKKREKELSQLPDTIKNRSEEELRRLEASMKNNSRDRNDEPRKRSPPESNRRTDSPPESYKRTERTNSSYDTKKRNDYNDYSKRNDSGNDKRRNRSFSSSSRKNYTGSSDSEKPKKTEDVEMWDLNEEWADQNQNIGTVWDNISKHSRDRRYH